MKLKPLGDNVVIKASEPEVQTKSGLLLAETAQEKPRKGEVIAVGDGKWDDEGKHRIPLDVKTGDTVLYKEWGGDKVKIDGDEFLIMSSSSILAVLTGK